MKDKAIQRVQFLTPVTLERRTVGYVNLSTREWRDWTASVAQGGGRIMLTAPSGNLWEVPRDNCVVLWGEAEAAEA